MNEILENYTIVKKMNSHVSLPVDTIKKFTKEFSRDYKYYLKNESLNEFFKNNKGGVMYFNKGVNEFSVTLK